MVNLSRILKIIQTYLEILTLLVVTGLRVSELNFSRSQLVS